MKATAKLRHMLNEKGLIVAPGAYDALSARIIEKEGFKAVYVGGAAMEASMLGKPDAGFLTMTESVGRASSVAAAVSVPVIADAEDGFGNPLNVMRTVAEYCKAGIAAVHIEDVGFEKHLESGGKCVPTGEMVRKIRAAADARPDKEFVIIGRTDALRIYGSLEEALTRAKAYAEAGADLIYMSGLSPADVDKVAPAIPVPLMNMNYPRSRGERPLSLEELEGKGLKVVIYPLEALFAVCKAVTEVVQEIARSGNTRALRDRMATMAQMEEILGKAEVDKLVRQYGGQ